MSRFSSFLMVCGGFVLGLFVASLAHLVDRGTAYAAPSVQKQLTTTASGANLEWSFTDGTWKLGLHEPERNFLVFHSSVDEPAGSLEPSAPFTIEVSPVAEKTSFTGGRIAVYEIQPTMICEHGVCLPCEDLGLCSFPPDPDDPDNPFRADLLRDGGTTDPLQP